MQRSGRSAAETQEGPAKGKQAWGNVKGLVSKHAGQSPSTSRRDWSTMRRDIGRSRPLGERCPDASNGVLSEQERSLATLLFKELDVNRNQLVAREELEPCLAGGIDEWETIYRRMDGYVSLHEWLEHCRTIKADQGSHYLRIWLDEVRQQVVPRAGNTVSMEKVLNKEEEEARRANQYEEW